MKIYFGANESVSGSKTEHSKLFLTSGLFCSGLLFLTSCSANAPGKGPIVEYYQPAYRQLAPEPVYSRVTWAHLPQPVKPRVRENAPIIMPTIAFDMPNSTLGESIQALAQAIGYNWTYPSEAASRSVAIKITGEVDAILREIGRQAGVHPVLDHQARVLRVVTGETIELATPEPILPGNIK